MEASILTDQAAKVATMAAKLFEEAELMANQSAQVIASQAGGAAASDGTFLSLFTIFVLSCFIGFYVVWSVTPALHSPLMAVTNAISSVIIVGGLLAAGPLDASLSKYMGFFAVMLASVNIFGGFAVTARMLAMFKKKKK